MVIPPIMIFSHFPPKICSDSHPDPSWNRNSALPNRSRFSSSRAVPVFSLCSFPPRDIQQENFRGIHSRWRSFSFVFNPHLFSACFLVVLLSILLYLLRLRRIHGRRSHGAAAASSPLWIPEKIPIPQKIPGPL